MLKYQYRLILDLVATIEEAQNKKMYADCQEAALALCDSIEYMTDKGSKTVELLENYCNLLFEANSGNADTKHLNKHLTIIKNSIQQELKPTRIEIAFISHIPSMSDSLESIYLAAKADPLCDAYWIPVPYYRIEPNGEPGEMRFESVGYYPDNIELTDYTSYDIEARQPDAIFTFNIYDAGNIVTRIHPDFYIEKLCKFTDMLVCVPYFVEDLNNYDVVKARGLLFAHKIILSSESVRLKYANLFHKNYEVPKSRFIALGNPKYDKVLSTSKHDYSLPSNWEQLIQGKPTILYNTSLEDILREGPNVYLKKLGNTLSSFGRRKDIVLWWRPHPLTEATLNAAKQLMLREYIRITESYKKGNYGIFDDTADLHRAIAVTDAYYGDTSSLISLYLATGKPVLLQNHTVADATNEFSDKTPEDIQNILYPEDIDKNKLILHEMQPLTLQDLCNYLVNNKPSQEQITLRQKLVTDIIGLPVGGSGSNIYKYISQQILRP